MTKYVVLIKQLFNDYEGGCDYIWNELSGIRHTTKEIADQELYDFKWKEVTDGEYVHDLKIKEIG